MKAFRRDALEDIAMDLWAVCRSIDSGNNLQDAKVIAQRLGHLRARLGAWHEWYLQVWNAEEGDTGEDIPF